MTQIQDPSAVRWTGVDTHPGSYAGLSVVLNFQSPDPSGRARDRQASCHYRYHVVDDTVLTLSNPLAAYSTSPESMTLDGQVLSASSLAAAVKGAMVREGRALLDTAREALENPAENPHYPGRDGDEGGEEGQ